MKKIVLLITGIIFSQITFAQNTVDGYLVRNNPEHDFMANLSINPVHLDLEPGNASFGCYLAAEFTVKNKITFEAKTQLPYLNFLHYETVPYSSSSPMGNSIYGEKLTNSWGAIGTYHFGGGSITTDSHITLKSTGNSHTTINYNVNLEDVKVYKTKGVRFGLNHYRSFFTLGNVTESTFFSTPTTVFPATVNMANNVHCTMLNIGLSKTEITDLIYHVNKLKIEGKTYTKMKDQKASGEFESYFDLLFNVKTSYDDMVINGTIYTMTSPVRKVGFRTGYTMRWYNGGSAGVGIGILPGLYTNQVFDNLFFTVFFGWNFTKIKN